MPRKDWTATAHSLTVVCSECGRTIRRIFRWSIRPLINVARDLDKCQFCGHRLEFDPDLVEVNLEG